MQIQGTFDANQFEPNQGGSIHPVGRFPFTITGTSIKGNKENTGGYLEVEITTPAGIAIRRYSLWPPAGDTADKTKEIAQGQLSALCRAVGRFQLRWEDQGAALRGATGMVEIGFQRGHEPSAEKPNGGYTEPKKFFDNAGNDPAGGNSGPAPTQHTNQPVQNAAPMTNNGGNWNNNANQAPQNTQQAGWNNQQQNAQPQNTQQPNPSGWQQNNGNAAPSGAPWGQR